MADGVHDMVAAGSRRNGCDKPACSACGAALRIELLLHRSLALIAFILPPSAPIPRYSRNDTNTLPQMYSVDRLNRQYEKLREAVEEPENVGPLEASVKSLQKEIGSVSQSSSSPPRDISIKNGWSAEHQATV